MVNRNSAGHQSAWRWLISAINSAVVLFGRFTIFMKVVACDLIFLIITETLSEG
jgi:hypothetical protein